MSLYQKLQQRVEENKPILVGMIGIGKFGSMYLAQVPNTLGVEVVGVVDLSPSQAKSNLLQVGWEGKGFRLIHCMTPSAWEGLM